MKRTIRGSFIFGVTSGYFHNNEGAKTADVKAAEAEALDNLGIISEAIKELALQVEKESGIYISGSLKPVSVVYHDDWGCPKGGERCYEFVATANPEFATDMVAWQDAFVALAKAVKVSFKQSTVMVDFVEAQYLYLAD